MSEEDSASSEVCKQYSNGLVCTNLKNTGSCTLVHDLKVRNIALATRRAKKAGPAALRAHRADIARKEAEKKAEEDSLNDYLTNSKTELATATMSLLPTPKPMNVVAKGKSNIKLNLVSNKVPTKLDVLKKVEDIAPLDEFSAMTRSDCTELMSGSDLGSEISVVLPNDQHSVRCLGVVKPKAGKSKAVQAVTKPKSESIPSFKATKSVRVALPGDKAVPVARGGKAVQMVKGDKSLVASRTRLQQLYDNKKLGNVAKVDTPPASDTGDEVPNIASLQYDIKHGTRFNNPDTPPSSEYGVDTQCPTDATNKELCSVVYSPSPASDGGVISQVTPVPRPGQATCRNFLAKKGCKRSPCPYWHDYQAVYRGQRAEPLKRHMKRMTLADQMFPKALPLGGPEDLDHFLTTLPVIRECVIHASPTTSVVAASGDWDTYSDPPTTAYHLGSNGDLANAPAFRTEGSANMAQVTSALMPVGGAPDQAQSSQGALALMATGYRYTHIAPHKPAHVFGPIQNLDTYGTPSANVAPSYATTASTGVVITQPIPKPVREKRPWNADDLKKECYRNLRPSIRNILLAPHIEKGDLQGIPTALLNGDWYNQPTYQGTFLRFPQLPGELQNQIWRYAYHNADFQHCRIKMIHEEILGEHAGPSDMGNRFVRVSRAPPLTEACQASRSLRGEFYWAAFETHWHGSDIPFNYKKDHLMLHSAHAEDFQHMVRSISKDTILRIRHLAIPLRDYVHNDKAEWARRITKFAKLETLTFIVGDSVRDEVYSKNRRLPGDISYYIEFALKKFYRTQKRKVPVLHIHPISYLKAMRWGLTELIW